MDLSYTTSRTDASPRLLRWSQVTTTSTALGLVNNTSALTCLCCSQKVRRRCVLCQWPNNNALSTQATTVAEFGDKLLPNSAKVAVFGDSRRSPFSATVAELRDCSRQCCQGLIRLYYAAGVMDKFAEFVRWTVPMLYETKTQNAGEFTYFVFHRRGISK